MTFETYIYLKMALAAIVGFVVFPLCLLWLRHRDKKRGEKK